MTAIAPEEYQEPIRAPNLEFAMAELLRNAKEHRGNWQHDVLRGMIRVHGFDAVQYQLGKQLQHKLQLDQALPKIAGIDNVDEAVEHFQSIGITRIDEVAAFHNATSELARLKEVAAKVFHRMDKMAGYSSMPEGTKSEKREKARIHKLANIDSVGVDYTDAKFEQFVAAVQKLGIEIGDHNALQAMGQEAFVNRIMSVAQKRLWVNDVTGVQEIEKVMRDFNSTRQPVELQPVCEFMAAHDQVTFDMLQDRNHQDFKMAETITEGFEAYCKNEFRCLNGMGIFANHQPIDLSHVEREVARGTGNMLTGVINENLLTQDDLNAKLMGLRSVVANFVRGEMVLPMQDVLPQLLGKYFANEDGEISLPARQGIAAVVKDELFAAPNPEVFFAAYEKLVDIDMIQRYNDWRDCDIASDDQLMQAIKSGELAQYGNAIAASVQISAPWKVFKIFQEQALESGDVKRIAHRLAQGAKLTMEYGPSTGSEATVRSLFKQYIFEQPQLKDLDQRIKEIETKMKSLPAGDLNRAQLEKEHVRILEKHDDMLREITTTFLGEFIGEINQYAGLNNELVEHGWQQANLGYLRALEICGLVDLQDPDFAKYVQNWDHLSYNDQLTATSAVVYKTFVIKGMEQQLEQVLGRLTEDGQTQETMQSDLYKLTQLYDRLRNYKMAERMTTTFAEIFEHEGYGYKNICSNPAKADYKQFLEKAFVNIATDSAARGQISQLKALQRIARLYGIDSKQRAEIIRENAQIKTFSKGSVAKLALIKQYFVTDLSLSERLDHADALVENIASSKTTRDIQTNIGNLSKILEMYAQDDDKKNLVEELQRKFSSRSSERFQEKYKSGSFVLKFQQWRQQRQMLRAFKGALKSAINRGDQNQLFGLRQTAYIMGITKEQLAKNLPRVRGNEVKQHLKYFMSIKDPSKLKRRSTRMLKARSQERFLDMLGVKNPQGHDLLQMMGRMYTGEFTKVHMKELVLWGVVDKQQLFEIGNDPKNPVVRMKLAGKIRSYTLSHFSQAYSESPWIEDSRLQQLEQDVIHGNPIERMATPAEDIACQLINAFKFKEAQSDLVAFKDSEQQDATESRSINIIQREANKPPEPTVLQPQKVDPIEIIEMQPIKVDDIMIIEPEILPVASKSNGSEPPEPERLSVKERIRRYEQMTDETTDKSKLPPRAQALQQKAKETQAGRDESAKTKDPLAGLDDLSSQGKLRSG